MDKTLSYFTYRPPKSNSFGHGVRGKNLSAGLEKVIKAFVENFGATTDGKIQLTLPYTHLEKDDLTRVNNTIAKLNAFLGQPKNQFTWETKDKNIFELLTYLDECSLDNILPLNHYFISLVYQYGNNTLPYGHINCLITSGKLLVQLGLILPYTTDDSRSYQLISKINKEFPFNLNSKHFRRLGPSKNGYGTWKLDEITQKRVEACLNQ